MTHTTHNRFLSQTINKASNPSLAHKEILCQLLDEVETDAIRATEYKDERPEDWAFENSAYYQLCSYYNPDSPMD